MADFEDLFSEIAEKHKVPAELIQQMIGYEQTRVHLQRRRGAKDELRRQIDRYLEERQR